jgi:two-component system sensor histidine kinase RegB
MTGVLPEPGAATAADGVALRWLIQVRTVALLGQGLVVLASRFFMETPTAFLLGLTAFAAASNVWASRQTPFRELPGLLLLLDTLILTGMLFLTGGAANPFSILYLAYIALAAVVLTARFTAVIALAAIVCYGVLFVIAPAPAEHVHGFDTHLRGMWVAFVLSAALVAFFVIRLRATLEERERELELERARASRNEKVAALVTLAAGAAHELATPLGTIALVAGELEGEISKAAAGEIEADLGLIRSEIARCRRILDDLAAGAGAVPGERPSMESPRAAVELCFESLTPAEVDRVVLGAIDPALRVFAPPRALGQCLTRLLRNAFDASTAGAPVDLRFRTAAGFLEVVVADRGVGMSPQDLRRAGDPFWTTKPPGKGMGLGLFLVRATLDQIGGRLDLASSPAGTNATMRLPLSGEVA